MLHARPSHQGAARLGVSGTAATWCVGDAQYRILHCTNGHHFPAYPDDLNSEAGCRRARKLSRSARTDAGRGRKPAWTQGHALGFRGYVCY
ncbi:hypothetical protein EI94DRAFT_868631 [Lactarius quietus]|nr:hypothetical protein EI94DRAFT_868631 [Lactarius quietus]